MDTSLRKLQHLVTVAETQSFSRAAELLHLSQPALSKSISAIEEAYGVRLLDRSRSGVHVTSVGADIIADAKRLLSNARSFHHNSQMLAGGERGQISLGIGPTAANLALSQLAGSVLGHGSGILLRTQIRPLGSLISNLVGEGIELLIATNPGIKIPDEIEYCEVGQVEGGFFVRRGHPLEHDESLAIRDILSYPLACQEEPIWLRGYNYDSNVLLCDNYTIIQDVMASTDTICILPRHFSAYANERNMMELLLDDWNPQKIPIIAGWLRGRSLSPIASEIVDGCKTILGDRAIRSS